MNEQPTIQKNAFKSRSQRGSTGGFAIAHVKTQGMDALIGAPKLFRDAAFRAPLAKKPKERKQSVEWPDVRAAFQTRDQALAIAVFFAGRLKNAADSEHVPALWRLVRHQEAARKASVRLLARGSGLAVIEEILECSMPGCECWASTKQLFVLHMKRRHGVTISVEG